MKKLVFLIITLILTPLLYINAQQSSVDLIWHGEVYTPPFYKGRSLWSSQSQLKIVAIANIPNTNPRNLFYKWTKNSTVLGTVNGVGKNTISINDPIFSKPQTIKVEVMSSDGAILGSSTVTLAPTKPSLLVYENNPLYGLMLHKEIGSQYNLENREITLSAFPLFFNVPNTKSSRLNYEWQTDVGVVGEGQSATYQIPEGLTGSSRVSIRIMNNDRITQDVRRSFLLKYDGIR